MSDQGNGSGSNGSGVAKGIFYHPSSLSNVFDLPDTEETLIERAQPEMPHSGNGSSYLALPAPQLEAGAVPIREQMPPAPGPAVVNRIPIGGQDLAHRPAQAEPVSRYQAATSSPARPKHTQAIGAWRQEEAHMLGLSTVTVATATVIGTRFGGLYGAIAGSLFGGAGINAMRAIKHAMVGTPEGDREALVSGTYTVVAASLGGYLTWQGIKAKRAKA